MEAHGNFRGNFYAKGMGEWKNAWENIRIHGGMRVTGGNRFNRFGTHGINMA